jgi:hypothetical protein
MHDEACQPASRPAFVTGQLKTVDTERAWKKTDDGDTTPGSSGGVTTRMNREELQGSSDIKEDTPTVSRFQWLSISDLPRHNTSSYLIRVIWHWAWEEPSCYCTKGIHGQAYLAQYAWYNNKKYVWNTSTYPYRNVSKGRASCISNTAARHSDLCLPWRTDLQQPTRNQMAREINKTVNRARCDVARRHYQGVIAFQNVMRFHGTRVKVISSSL